MAWIESRKKQSGGGGQQFDVLIDWTLYSHPSAFDSISMPANYTDYDHLAFTIIQANVDQDYMKFVLNACLQYYVEGNQINTFLVVDSADIEDVSLWSSRVYNFPILTGYSVAKGTEGSSHMNTQELLGYSYSWGWQDLYLICFGFND